MTHHEEEAEVHPPEDGKDSGSWYILLRMTRLCMTYHEKKAELHPSG